MKQFTLSEKIQIAKLQTYKATRTKDWRLTRKADKAAKQAAKDLAARKGYIIATPAELKQMYPQFVRWNPGADADQKMVWCFYPSVRDHRGRARIDLVTI